MLRNNLSRAAYKMVSRKMNFNSLKVQWKLDIAQDSWSTNILEIKSPKLDIIPGHAWLVLTW